MPRQPTPWFRKNRGWYVQLDGKKIFLGHGRQKAYLEYHRLMAGKCNQPPFIRMDDPCVVSVLDAYLGRLATVSRPRRLESPTYIRLVSQLPSGFRKVPGKLQSHPGSDRRADLTHYEKTARNYLTFVHVASITVLWR
jgi:hypothetical protein